MQDFKVRQLVSFVLVLAGSFVLTGMLWIAPAFQGPRPATNLTTRWIESLSTAKEAAAASRVGPRILIIGGSGALFGLKAETIERETHVPTINMAVHVGLGVPYTLQRAERTARRGDLVLLAFEYHAYSEPDNPDLALVELITARDRDYFDHLSLRERILTAIRSNAPISPVIQLMRGGSRSTGVYDRFHLNANGDMTATEADNRPKGALERLAAAAPAAIIMDGLPRQESTWKAISEFKDWAARNGVTIAATFPNILRSDAYMLPGPSRALAGLRDRYERLGIPVIGTPSDFMYPANDFFDTEYHLTAQAAEQRTLATVQLMGPTLQQWRPGSAGSGEPAAHSREVSSSSSPATASATRPTKTLRSTQSTKPDSDQ
jgi:hypothetical protein